MASRGDQEDVEGWLLARPVELPESPLPRLRLGSTEDLAEGERDRMLQDLDIAPPEEVAVRALHIARQPLLHSCWGAVQQRLLHVELQPMDAVAVLHCMVGVDCFDRELLRRVVDCIELRYHSMELGLPQHEVAELFPHSGDFQSLVHGLPVEHKVKLILGDNVARDTGLAPRKKPVEEPDPKAAWKTMDPVEMEAWERERYEKGRIRVARMRYVEAKISRSPGNRLRASLAAHLLQAVPTASPAVLAQIAQVCTHPGVRLMRGDMREDFQEAVSSRLLSFEVEEVRPFTLAFASALRHFGGSQAFRAWHLRMLPAVMQLTRSPRVLDLLDAQQHFHPRLLGVPRAAGPSPDGASPDELLRIRADRAVLLFISVVLARQVTITCELFDALAGPVRRLIRAWLDSLESAPGDSAADRVLLPLETVADTWSALVSCGVEDAEMAQLLASLFCAQFAEDIREGPLALAPYNIVDLANIAHAGALCGGAGADTVQLAWAAAQPGIRDAEPHLALMLLNAAVAAGSEELLRSKPLLALVDELLVQKLDYDPAVLGRVGR